MNTGYILFHVLSVLFFVCSWLSEQHSNSVVLYLTDMFCLLSNSVVWEEGGRIVLEYIRLRLNTRHPWYLPRIPSTQYLDDLLNKVRGLEIRQVGGNPADISPGTVCKV